MPTIADWEGLLGRPAVEQTDACHSSHRNRCVLITGAGGSIGTELTMRLCCSEPRLLLLLEASEQNLYELDASLRRRGTHIPYIAILGGIDDESLLAELFSQHRPEMIYHTAAYKHVPLMEANPFAVVRNNTLGTYRLAQAALRHHIEHLLMVSTDKAVRPSSIMGASKRMAELVLLSCSNTCTRMSSVRLGNVLASEGSVVRVFLDQIMRGEIVTVTHPDARRFFFTMAETVSLILEAASHAQGRQILIPRIGRPTKIVDLANYLIAKSGSVIAGQAIAFTALRPGEKLVEEFVGPGERLGACIGTNLHALASMARQEEEIHRAIVDLEDAVRVRSLPALLQVIAQLVPEYIPTLSFGANSLTRLPCSHA